MHPREALFLSFMVTYCSGERSFSRFTITKNDLKGPMFQERLLP